MPNLGPETLTHSEQQAIIDATSHDPRASLLLSLALGTGLRLSELTGLDVGDLYSPAGKPRTRLRIRSEIAKRGRAGDAFLPDALIPKLTAFWRYKENRHERLDPTAPLFCNLSRRRLSPRRLQMLFHDWQKQAGFDRRYPFHALRHSAITNVYRASRDLFLAQRFARHASPLTTVIYTHPSDEELRSRLQSLFC